MRISDWSSDVCSSDLLTIDDEGTPTQHNVLIEDGILKGYIQDRLNARLMGVAPTGNGRRESYAHAPMPRMTNTFMLGGSDDPGEILSRAKKGIFAKSFGGGQVDITSGKRAEEHTSELQSLMRISYAVFCLKKKKKKN